MTAPTRDAVLALREDAALCRHGLRQLLHASGSDALVWLERILSQPVAEIAAGHTVSAVFMDGKGRIRADIRVLALSDPSEGLCLELPADEGKLLKLLTMFVVLDDVTLAPSADQAQLLTIAGPQSPGRLEAAGVRLPEEDSITLTESGAAVVCSRLAGVSAYDLLGSEQQLQPLLNKLSEPGLLEVDRATLNCVRIAAGAPWFHDDLAADIIPLEALLKSHVSVTKGCYPGQEIVARITNRGQVSRKLVRLTAPAGQAPAPGAELLGCAPHEGKAAGVVTSSCIDPVDQSVQALGYVRRLFWKSQTEVTAGELSLTVNSLDGD